MSDKLQTYNWWGSGENEPPPHLKTKRQLQELKLRPVKPVGVIHCREYDCLLFDPANPESVKPKRKATSSQLEVLASNREKQKRRRIYEEWYENYGFIECDARAAVKWARKLLEQDDACILDTETTGLGDAEIVEIAVIDRHSRPLLNTLVLPTIPIPAQATAIHGITNEMVANSPTFPEVFESIRAAIKGKIVLIYNVDFDIRVLRYCRKLHDLSLSFDYKELDCVMKWYSQWCGDWNGYWEEYRWQPLNGGHRAMSDCLATLDRIKEMALDKAEIAYPENVYPPPDYGF